MPGDTWLTFRCKLDFFSSGNLHLLAALTTIIKPTTVGGGSAAFFGNVVSEKFSCGLRIQSQDHLCRDCMKRA